MNFNYRRKPGNIADARSMITGLFPFDRIDPETLRGWMFGLECWFKAHPIDYDNLHKHMGRN